VNGVVRDDFPSVSKLMKLFYDEFPAEEVAKKLAKGNPYVMHTYLEEWKQSGLTSTNMGSRVHYELELETVNKFKIDNIRVNTELYNPNIFDSIYGKYIITTTYSPLIKKDLVIYGIDDNTKISQNPNKSSGKTTKH
jgi:hypothetical protein